MMFNRWLHGAGNPEGPIPTIGLPDFELTAQGIYYINEMGEKVWFADINASGGFGTIITKGWMDAETAKAYFNAMMNEYSSLSTKLAIGSMPSGSVSGLVGGVLTGSNVAGFVIGGVVTIQTGVASINAGILANRYGNFQTFVSPGVIYVNTTVVAPNPMGYGSPMILFKQVYYSIGGGLIGSWSRTIRP